MLYQLTRLIWLILAAVETILLFRFILRLFGANPAAQFTQFVYDLSAPLIAPFQFVFTTNVIQGNVFEWSSLLAIIVYWFLAWGIIKALLLTRPVSTTEVHSHLDEQERI